ncbi:MAG: hypothetical protein ABGX16_07310 [Pirellulales bacterium]
MNTIQLPAAMRILVNVALSVTLFAASTYCEAMEPPTGHIRTGDVRTEKTKPSCLEPTVAGPVPQVYDPISIYRDGRLTLHTDLPPCAAQATLDEMKLALRFSEKYWQQRLRGSLECYVAADASRWPDSAFSHPLARVWIDCIGGATVSEQVPKSSGQQTKATLYASTRPGAVRHEIVHAYCCQTFGQSGPDWYDEGLATVVGYGCHDDRGVQCPQDVLATLRQKPCLSMHQVFQSKPFTSATYKSLSLMVANRKNLQEQVSLTCWTPTDTENLAAMRQSYDWSWSFCYLLFHDPNYQDQFRKLGAAYMAGHRPSYQQVFGVVQQQLAFDYRTFLQHVDLGYRVDLCSWEWNKTFQKLDGNRPRTRIIKAAHGYQATGVEVVLGQRYNFVAHGNWSTSHNASTTDANGQLDGAGRLESVVLSDDYQLSKPFELGTSGIFTAPSAGRLYVRCRDQWNQLADNQGTLRVSLSQGRFTKESD